MSKVFHHVTGIVCQNNVAAYRYIWVYQWPGVLHTVWLLQASRHNILKTNWFIAISHRFTYEYYMNGATRFEVR